MENTTSNTAHMAYADAANNKNSGEQKPTKTYERKTLENTPFIIHESEDHGWAAGIAEHRLTGWYQTEEELKTILKGYTPKHGIDWNLLTGVVLILIEKAKELDKLNNKIEEQNKQTK